MKTKLHKFVILMSRITIYSLLLCQTMVFAIAHESDAQRRLLEDHNISFDFAKSEISLMELVDEIEKNSEFTFSYGEQHVKDKIISLTSDNWNMSTLLKEVSIQARLSIKRINETIALKPIEKSHNLPEIEELMDDDAVTINGRVTDDNGETLPGATIKVLDSPTGTVTDIDGNYSLEVEDNAVLVFSFVGFLPQQVSINGRSSINISLKPDIESLDEVVVVGYGVTRKSDITGSVVSVKSEDLVAYPAASPIQALQGRAAGVNIQSTNGAPGADFKISIRGSTSISAGSDPLIVVDGLVGAILPPPEDIASLEVLKDASASAIYGSRAANGVVLVTTKKGKAGESRINFSASFSRQEEIGRLDLLSGDDFFDYVNSDSSASKGFFDPTVNTSAIDWQDEILRSGQIRNYQLSASGGSENISYYLSGVYFNNEGLIDRSAFERVSVNSNIDAKVNDFFSVTFSNLIQRSTQNGVLTQDVFNSGAGGNRLGVTLGAYKTEPTLSILDDNGNYSISGFDPNWENPVGVLEGYNPEVVRDLVQSNIRGKFDLSGLVEGLSFNPSIGITRNNIRNSAFASSKLTLSSPGGSAVVVNSSNLALLTEHYLAFERSINQSQISIVGGYSYQGFRTERIQSGAGDFINDSFDVWNLSAGAAPGTPQSSLVESEIASFYGRANYGFDGRYLVTFTGRYDGSSQFSEGNKWGFFPSAAVGWNVSNEAFFPQDIVVSNFKMRASYGLTGNRAIAPFQTFARLANTFLSPNLPAVEPTVAANSNLSWETTKQLNVGANLAFFENRLELELDYYKMNTEDLLFSRSDLPLFSGYGARLENLGEVENRGFELATNAIIADGDFSWNAGFNISWNQSEVISLPDTVDQFIGGSIGTAGPNRISNILREGEAVGALYGWVYEGVYQNGDEFLPGAGFEAAPGGERFADINGDGTIDEEDRVILGDPNPDFIFGFNNSFAFKGFDLNVFIQGAQGGKILNVTRMDLDLGTGANNATTDMLNRWTSENTDTNVPVVNSSRNYRTSSRWLEDASYIRLKNIALGYSVPQKLLKKLNMKSCRIYVSAQNMLTITDYTGIDPEVSFSREDGGLNYGLDFGSYPNAKTYTFGFNIGL